MIEIIGGPDRDRTDDLFHAMEARSQLRHRPTLKEGLLSFSPTGTLSSMLRELRELIALSPVSKESE